MPFNPPPPPEKPFKVRMDSAGRVLLPAELRRKLGIEPGENLMMRVTDAGCLEAWTTAYWLREAQETFGKWQPGQPSAVDELIAERRAENARDEAEVAESERQRVLRERGTYE